MVSIQNKNKVYDELPSSYDDSNYKQFIESDLHKFVESGVFARDVHVAKDDDSDYSSYSNEIMDQLEHECEEYIQALTGATDQEEDKKMMRFTNRNSKTPKITSQISGLYTMEYQSL